MEVAFCIAGIEAAEEVAVVSWLVDVGGLDNFRQERIEEHLQRTVKLSVGHDVGVVEVYCLLLSSLVWR